MTGRQLVAVSALVLATTPLGTTGLRGQTAPTAADTWTGAISLPVGPLGITVTLQRDGAGAWNGTIDIPAQGAKGVPLGDIVVADRAVSFRLPGNGDPTMTGRLSDDLNRFSGTFAQGGASLRFDLVRGTSRQAKARNRPQEPTRPFPYREEDVAYRNEPARITLAGTLTDRSI